MALDLVKKTRPDFGSGASTIGSAVRIALRAVLIGLAGATLLWAWSTLPSEMIAQPLVRVAHNIISGEKYDLTNLAPALAYLDRRDARRDCTRRELPASAVIRFYAGALADQAEKSDEAIRLWKQAREDVRATLACNPHLGYYWFALFWIENQLEESGRDFLPLLAESYKLAPREGWINEVRSRVALPYYDDMSPELQSYVRAEYLLLCRDAVRAAASTFAAVGDSERKHLLTWLLDVPVETRRNIAEELDRRNVQVDIPGVDYRDGRVLRERSKG